MIPGALTLLLALTSPPAHLWLGGDVELGRGGHAALAPLSKALAGSTGVVNLEGAVAALPAAGPGLRLLNSAAVLPELRAAGIAVAGIANNHAGDAGPLGPSATARALLQAGLRPAGGPAGPALFDLGGLRVAITAHDLTGGVPVGLAGQLAAARAHADVLIATFHTTTEPRYLPPPELRQAVETALAAGAAVVAAHGSHEVGPVERRGQAIIAWGLGNLVFDCDCTSETEGLILTLTLGRAGVVEAGLLPITAGLKGAAVSPAAPGPMLELLEALGSSPLRQVGDRLSF